MSEKIAPAETTIGSSGAGRGATILTVEDSPVQAELLRRALEGAGYKVIVAGNGAEGLAMAKANHPVAVVSDINMPVMDGYALCRAIRGDAALKHTPVILLTMLSDPLDVIRGLNAGADAYLTKPYNIPALAARVASLLAYPPVPPPATERRKIEVRLAGETHLIDAHGPRMLNLLVSTYENAVLQSRELTATQQALEDLNQHLEHRVLEQTAALQAGAARYERAVNGANDGIWEWIPASGEDYLSPRWKQLLGYEDHELPNVQESFLNRIHPEDQARIREAIRAHLEERKPYQVEFRLRCKSGEYQWFSSRGQAEWDEQGRPLRMAGSISDITERKRAEDQIQQYVAQLKTAFMNTVEVATTLSEMRDPYTAGHERRVAEIAAAIGAELGFDARGQEGLRVAGYLHDVGKLTIPTEILTKPGKFTAAEFKLIRGHAQASYDVLKDAEFPWPVAEIALQHHEHMDGSGYPRGLKGEAMRLEARVIAVADVVEAMSSRRPYRPALGIEAALAEIERGRGTLYDPVVADACLKLFREQSYIIPV